MTTARANWRAVEGSTARSIGPSRKCTCQSSGRRMVNVSGAPAIAVTCLVPASLEQLRRGAGQSDAVGAELLDRLLEPVRRRARQRAAIALAADNLQLELEPAAAQ